jgi:hypothetical protein
VADNPLEGLLSPDELKLIKARREDERKNSERTVRIRDGESEADVPWGEAIPWLKKKFGIGVTDDETGVETKDDKEADTGDTPGDGETKTRFGRRVS